MGNFIHAEGTRPRIFPWASSRDPEQISRAQDLGGDLTLTQTKLYEIGRVGKLGVHKETPAKALTLRQFENGDMNFWRDIANLVDPASSALDESVDLDDIKTKRFDIATFLTDDAAVFQGTSWFPGLRVNGFSINIGDPKATVERSFDLIGEDHIILTDKFLAFNKHTASGVTEVVTLSPVAVEWASGDYVFRVLRVRGSAVSVLEEGVGANQWSYATGDVTVNTCEVGDIIKVYYESSTAYTTIWTDNDVAADAVYADQCVVYLKVGIGANERVYRLQSVGIDVAFEREDLSEIGNKDVVQTSSKSETVTVSLTSLPEGFTIEEILRGTSAYPYIDAREFSDEVTLIVKIYTDNTHTVELIGYKITDLSLTVLGANSTIQANNTASHTLESDNFFVTPDFSEL